MKPLAASTLPVRIVGERDCAPDDSSSGRWALHDRAASQRAEQAAAAAQTAPLMERAGLSVARLALALRPHARHVAVLCGPGNNGGDGLVAARWLHRQGLAVTAWLIGEATRRPADAAAALVAAQAAGVDLRLIDQDGLLCGGHDLVIDALLGLGTQRRAEGAIAGAIAYVNAQSAPVLAVDLPSALDPDTGQAHGTAVRATATLSLLTLKPGCFTAQGRDLCGDIWFDDLDVDAGDCSAWLSGRPPPYARRHASHKGSFGDVLIVGGAAGMAGAAWLAARAASAAGAGRVYCGLLDEAGALLDPPHPELMARRGAAWADAESLAALTVVCGCGGGESVAAEMPPLLEHAGRLILDADALNAVAHDDALLRALHRRADSGRPSVLTPHPLEAARLLACPSAQVQDDRLAAARQLALHTRCTVLLKGSGSVIAGAGRAPHINPTGSAALATAGTGDVLAGWIGGSWAQAPLADPVDVAADAAWWHGEAADRFVRARGPVALRAGQLVEWLADRGRLA